MRRASHTILTLAAVAVSAGCHEARGMTDAAPGARSTPSRPEPCATVGPGASVQAALDDPAVQAVCLAPGDHRGPFQLTRAVTLWGPSTAVIRGGGAGTIVELLSPGAAVLGATIDGAGGRFDHLDGAVRLAANDTRVEGVTVTNAVFGILVERAARVRVVGNHIEGSRDPDGLRGDTMRIWETRDSLIADNSVEDGRDLVIWYSRGNKIIGNRIAGARYGLHFMYSHDNQVIGNQLLDGVVGVFVMYSRGLHLTDNLIANAAGAAGMAIGIKDSGNIYVTGNRLIHDTIGIYIDSSPMQRGDVVEIERNVLRLNDTAVVFHSSAHDVRIHDNDFADNGTQVRVDGGGNATAVDWRANYFDDYAGYDLDDDGVGDVAFELRSLSNQLTASIPGVALFRGTPALALVDAAAHLDPLYQPQPVLTDPAPRIDPRWAVDRLDRTSP